VDRVDDDDSTKGLTSLFKLTNPLSETSRIGTVALSVAFGPSATGSTARAHSCAACVVWRDGHRLDIFDPVIVFISPHAAAHYDPTKDFSHGQAR
jgi:hypothetical protein